MIEEFARKLPQMLGFHYRTERRQLATFAHPIQGWYVTATRGDNGAIVLDDPMPIQLNSPTDVLPVGPVPGGKLGSRLSNGLNSQIAHVLIIADTNKITGHTVGGISDYLTLLALSQTRSPETCGQLPSIFDMMVADCGGHEKPDSVTAGDLAFLQALYATDLREGLDLERNDIRNGMMRTFRSH